MADERSLEILRTVYRLQPVTRRQLCEQTGLSAGRISMYVTQLLAQGAVCQAMGESCGHGRPASVLRVEPGLGHIVGLDIGGTKSRAILTDLQGQVRAHLSVDTVAVPDRDLIITNIVELVQRVCGLGGLHAGQLVGLGAGLQATVDASSGVVLDWANTPIWADAWRGLDVVPELSRRLGTRLIVVEDIARAMGVTSYHLGQGRGKADFLYVYLGDGIGCGLILYGRPFASCSGLASELGHVCVEEDGPPCACGNRGCLEMFASTAAILGHIRERLSELPIASSLKQGQQSSALSIEMVLQAARHGDKLAFQVIDEAGTYVGKVIATVLNVLGCQLVVLGGPLTHDGGVILDAVQRQVRWRALEHISRRVRIVYDDQGELAGARGVALLASDALFDSMESLQRLLAANASAARRGGEPAAP